MDNIKLFADSTCDLPIDKIKEMDVGIVPLLVTFNNKTYRDGVDIKPDEMFNLVDKYNTLPKTSSPSPLDFYKAFEPFVNKGKEIIYIGLSSKLSSTIQNAQLAARQFPKGAVRVIDSLNLCGAIGGLITYAHEFVKKGFPIDKIVNIIEKMVPNYKLFFAIETLDYIHMGGRCNSVEKIFGSMLNIKPIINMSIEGLKVWKKTRGKSKAINLMINELVKDKDRIYKDELHIACASGNEEEMEQVKKQIETKTGIKTFSKYTTGCVISSHCGRGTVGFGYYLK